MYVLLCLVCLTLLASFFLPSHLSFKKHVHLHACEHVHVREMKKEGWSNKQHGKATQHTQACIYMYIFMFNSENQSENVCLPFSSPRVMGSLLSAYLLTQSPPHSSPFPHSPVLPHDDPISERLLELAHDLAIRLLPAFENTATGIPHPRVRAHMYIRVLSWRLHNSPLPPSLPPPPHPLPPSLFTLHLR